LIISGNPFRWYVLTAPSGKRIIIPDPPALPGNATGGGYEPLFMRIISLTGTLGKTRGPYRYPPASTYMIYLYTSLVAGNYKKSENMPLPSLADSIFLKFPVAFQVIPFYTGSTRIFPTISYKELPHDQIRSDLRFIHQRKLD
jgi:hypothetical protein